MKSLLKLLCHKVKRNYEDYGILNTVFKSVFSVIGIIYRRKVFRIYKKDISCINKPVAGSEYYDFKKISSKDENHISFIENIAEWMDGCLRDMIDKGSCCYVFLKNEKIIAFNLVSFGEIYIPLIHYNKKFPRNSAWSEHIWVDKNFRNNDIATNLRINAFSDLSMMGIKWLYGGCLTCNKISLKLAEKLNFRNIMDISYIRIMNFKKWKIKRIS